MIDWFDWFLGSIVLLIALALMGISAYLVNMFIDNLDVISIMVQSSVVYMKTGDNLILVLLIATTVFSIISILIISARR